MAAISGGAASAGLLWTSRRALVGGRDVGKIRARHDFFHFFTALPTAFRVNLWLASQGRVFGVLIALIACHFGCASSQHRKLAAGRLVRLVTRSLGIVAERDFAVIFSDVGWS